MTKTEQCFYGTSIPLPDYITPDAEVPDNEVSCNLLQVHKGDHVVVNLGGGSGRHGQIVEIHYNPLHIVLSCGTAAHRVEYHAGQVHGISRKEWLPIEKCIDQNEGGECTPDVDHRTIPPRGNLRPLCAHHQELRWDQFDFDDYHSNSLAAYADSDVPPSWFDPADAGERWDDDY